MGKYSLTVNQETYTFEVASDTPLLWVLRDTLKLYGTKYGCGIGQCGACTVHIDGLPYRSCCIPIENIKDQSIVTIEGLSEDGTHTVQLAWQVVDVPQCGYCQSGQIMTAAALLDRIPQPTEADINRAMKGNICRCGTYARIKEAIKLAAKNISS